MSPASRSVGFWPALPTHVLGRPLPRWARGTKVRFADADRLLVRLVQWLEESPPAEMTSQMRQVEPAAAPVASGPDRDTLVCALIDLRERLSGSSPALDQMVLRALADVGVSETVQDGEPFDTARHRAAGKVLTSDPALHGRIASTDRIGYADNGRLIQEPEVLVYRLDGHED